MEYGSPIAVALVESTKVAEQIAYFSDEDDEYLRDYVWKSLQTYIALTEDPEPVELIAEAAILLEHLKGKVGRIRHLMTVASKAYRFCGAEYFLDRNADKYFSKLLGAISRHGKTEVPTRFSERCPTATEEVITLLYDLLSDFEVPRWLRVGSQITEVFEFVYCRYETWDETYQELSEFGPRKAYHCQREIEATNDKLQDTALKWLNGMSHSVARIAAAVECEHIAMEEAYRIENLRSEAQGEHTTDDANAKTGPLGVALFDAAMFHEDEEIDCALKLAKRMRGSNKWKSRAAKILGFCPFESRRPLYQCADVLEFASVYLALDAAEKNQLSRYLQRQQRPAKKRKERGSARPQRGKAVCHV